MAEDVKLVLRYRVEANAPLAYQKPILLMEGDKRANVLQVSLFDGEKPVDVTGLTVGGSVLRADGADVAIEGEIEGNVISCVLSEYAYAVAGPFKAFVQLLDSLGDVKRTVLLLAGMVESRGHGPQIDTGKELPSLDDILAQLETMRNVTQAANTAAGDANSAAAAANSAASNATGAANSATTAAGTANAAADRANDAAKNWEEGTAANSSLLANKPPEYYTWSNNLLYNSNFESLYLVNHLGYDSGSAVSPWGEFINCWVNANDAEKAFTLSSDGISMPANTTIWQIANRVSDGDTVTIAVCDGNGDVYAASGTVRFNSDGSWYRCIIGNGNNFGLYADTYNGEFEFIIWAENVVKIKWAVLYKGTYTADTLPQPQWLHPRLEMIRMGLETQPVNLLDNSDFANPVNQRGQTTYSDSGTYAIDRWYVGGPNQRIDIVSGGIKGVTTKGSAFATIAQNVANVTRYAGKTLTFAAYVRSNVVPRLNIYNGGTSFSTKEGTSGDYNLIVCSFVVPDNITDGALSVRIQSKSTQEDDYVEAKWAALYEGSYTAETLPPYVPKGYTAELAECKRYYQKYSVVNTMPMMNGICLSETSARLFMFINPMRTRPTATFITPTTAIPYMTSNGTTVAQGTLSYHVAYTKDANIIEFIFSITGGATNMPVYLVSNAAVYLELSAEL